MKHSLIPTLCFWCDIGRVVSTKCMNCGAIFGVKREPKTKKSVSGFILPTVREANPTHYEKDRREGVRRKSKRTTAERRRNP